MKIKLINMHPRELFKTLEDDRAEIIWAKNDTTTPSIKNVKYLKPNLPKNKQTAFYVFRKSILDLRP